MNPEWLHSSTVNSRSEPKKANLRSPYHPEREVNFIVDRISGHGGMLA